MLGNSAVKRQLEEVDVERFDSILVMSDESRENDVVHSDSHTLATLLLLRELQRQRRRDARGGRLLGAGGEGEGGGEGGGARRRPSIGVAEGGARQQQQQQQQQQQEEEEEEGGCLVVCEVLDFRTRDTILSCPELANAADYVQSNEFVSRVLAMVAERREVKAVLDELLGEEGASLRVRSAAHYCEGEERLSFAHLSKRARDQPGGAEIIVGYCELGGEPQLNPARKYELRCWAGTEIIVLEHEQRLSRRLSGKEGETMVSPSGLLIRKL